MISLREHVRIHKASLKIVMQRVEYMLGGVDFVATQGLKGRLDDAFQLLEYYEVTATTLLEQQQNLLSLVGLSLQHFQKTYLQFRPSISRQWRRVKLLLGSTHWHSSSCPSASWRSAP